MTRLIDTIVIGGGHAGLATSYYLSQHGREHVVLERQRIAESWRSARWDSFTLITPNWTLRLPGFEYQSDDPNGFLTRDEIIQYLEDYVRLFDPPVQTGVEVSYVEGVAGGNRFRVETSAEEYEASHVVVATGGFQKLRVPVFSTQIASHILQLHASQYRNPQALPAGAVLVVGSGQSGFEIVKDLQQHGRQVYLSTGGSVRVMRRYRGKDAFSWAKELGMFNKTADMLPSPAARFAANPLVTGNDGDSAMNLHDLAEDGVILLGRLRDADGTKVYFAADLRDNLAAADKSEAEFRQAVDSTIAQTGMQAPPSGDEPEQRAGYDSEIITELDLDASGITSIVWAGGYSVDFSWLNFPIFDEFSYPIHQRGVSAQPGLYFLGLRWLHRQTSTLLLGIEEDAAHVVAHIASNS